MNHKRLAPIFFAAVMLLVVSLACGTASNVTPPPSTEANVPVQVITQVVTVIVPPAEQPTSAPPTSAPPPTEASQQFFTEEFDNDSGNWSERVEKNAEEGDLSKAKIALVDGYLSFDLGKWLIAYKFYDPYEYTNVRIDVRVDNRGTNVNNILLICRSSDEGHYLVNIANSGLFAMYAYNGAKDSYTRMADGGSNKIKPGKEVNEYSLLCSEKNLTIYINGIETRQYTDNQFAFRKGKIGVGIASEDQLPVTVDFDWVKISEP